MGIRTSSHNLFRKGQCFEQSVSLNNMNVFEKWKGITDGIYSGELDALPGVGQLIELLKEKGTHKKNLPI